MRDRLLALSVVLAGIVSCQTLAQEDAPKSYNLLVIMTDEHNFRTLGCYRDALPAEQAFMWGEAVVETPNIDWIADHGAMCTSFYATTPVCSPSRGAFVSGRYPQHTPVVTNNTPLADDVVTFAEILRRQGYKTGYAGKWHLDGSGKPQWAPRRKFGFEDNRFMFNRGHWKKLEITADGPRVAARNAAGRPNYNVASADQQTFTTDFLTDRTIEFIRAHQNEPFCYMLSLPDPHGPDTVRAPYDTVFADQTYTRPRSAEKPDEGLPSWGKKGQGGYNMANYYGMVKCIDDNVGRLLDELRAAQLLEHTIVVFTSDHGDLRGEHHRHNKGVPYEGSTRIPFLVHCPGKVRSGTVIDEALTSVDFLPTVLRLMEVDTVRKEQGRDASVLFTNGKAPENWTDVAFIRGTGKKQGWLAVVTDRYKLVYSPVDPPWLFDLERDPDEVTNLFQHAGYRQTVQELSKLLRNYSREFDDPFATLPRIRADLDWAIQGTGEYGEVEPAIDRFERLKRLKLGVKHMVLRIGAIALEHDGRTRNVTDFQSIPDLTIEDWSS